MFPIFHGEDFKDADLSSSMSLNSLNLFHQRTDVLYDYAECVFERLEFLGYTQDYFWTALHGNPEEFATIVYWFKRFSFVRREHVYTPADLADEICNSGEWYGEPVVLLACSIGANIYNTPAHELAYELGCPVYAAKEDVYITRDGFFYVNNCPVDSWRDPVLLYENQEEQWIKCQ